MAARLSSGLLLKRPNSPPTFRLSGGRGYIHILSAPSTSSIHPPMDLSEQTSSVPKLSGNGPFPQETQFEVLGNPFSLLSISLPAYSTVYTRRGTLLGLNGKAENVTSTLSMLKPFRRILFGIPFLYQKIKSTTPLTCLISTNSLNSSFAVINLDGKADWIVVQRKALLAWSGHSLIINPTLERQLSLAYWGNSKVGGRGLVALVGRGQVFQIVLQPGEKYLIHPSYLLAYSLNTAQPPEAYRLPLYSIRLQVPNLVVKYISKAEFLRRAMESDVYKTIKQFIFNVQQWIRQKVFGDRQMLWFQGPVTILVQSRSTRLRDITTKRDVDDTSLVEPMSVAPNTINRNHISEEQARHQLRHLGRTKVATVDGSGKVIMSDSDLKEFVRS